MLLALELQCLEVIRLSKRRRVAPILVTWLSQALYAGTPSTDDI